MKIDSYNKLPIGKYLDILALDKEQPDLEYKTEVVAILNGTTVEAVLDQPLTVTRDQMQAADFLLQPMPRHDGKKVASSYKLGGLTLIPCTNVRNWNTAQYIDYQTYAKNTNPKVIPELLSCVLVPKGCAYNSGYDITAVHQAIRDYLPVAEAHRISAFFLRKFLRYTRTILTYSLLDLKKIPKKERTAKQTELIRQTQRLVASLTAGGGFTTLM